MKVTLPDGTPLDLPDGATGADAAAAIGPGLARAALAVKQNGEVRDLYRPLVPDAPLEIVTDRSGQDALDLIRPDAAHALAAGVGEPYPRGGDVSARPHSPRRAAGARGGRARPLSRREDLHRAADRAGLLLRLRLPRRRL